MKVLSAALLLFPVTIVCAGCDFIGPQSIQNSRASYNSAIQHTGKEQTVLNLVRLRYDDPPQFVDVSGVQSVISLQGTTTDSVAIPDRFGKNVSARPWCLGVGATAIDNPTISYQPLQGDAFVKTMMSPISLDVIASLYHSGWDIRPLMYLTVSRLGPMLVNSTLSENNYNFKHAIDLMRDLQVVGALDLGIIRGAVDPKTNQSTKPDSLVISVDLASIPALGLREQARKKSDELAAYFPKIEPSSTTQPATKHSESLDLGQSFIFRQAARAGTSTGRGPAAASDQDESNDVRTRTVFGLIACLSTGVDVPDIDKDSVGMHQQPIAQAPALRIHSVKSAPSDAFIAVPYRKSWFYIDDQDVYSKQTFMMLSQIISAQSTGLQNTSLLLTQPVGNH